MRGFLRDHAVEAVARNDRVPMIGIRIAIQHAFPEVRTAVAHQPERVEAHLLPVGRNVVRYRDEAVLDQELAHFGIHLRHALVVFLARLREVELGQVAIAMPLEGVESERAFQLALRQRQHLIAVVRHELDAAHVPVEQLLADSGLLRSWKRGSTPASRERTGRTPWRR